MGSSKHVVAQVVGARGRARARARRLREAGVPVPSAPLPPQREIDYGERVWFDRDKVDVVVDYVRLHLSPTTAWDFNYEDEQAWVIAESSVIYRRSCVVSSLYTASHR